MAMSSFGYNHLQEPASGVGSGAGPQQDYAVCADPYLEPIKFQNEQNERCLQQQQREPEDTVRYVTAKEQRAAACTPRLHRSNSFSQGEVFAVDVGCHVNSVLHGNPAQERERRKQKNRKGLLRGVCALLVVGLIVGAGFGIGKLIDVNGTLHSDKEDLQYRMQEVIGGDHQHAHKDKTYTTTTTPKSTSTRTTFHTSAVKTTSSTPTTTPQITCKVPTTLHSKAIFTSNLSRLTNGARVAVATTIKFSCQPGWKVTLTGQRTASCLESGQWDTSNWPSCNERSCSLPSLSNGNYLDGSRGGDAKTAGTKVLFECQDDYIFKQSDDHTGEVVCRNGNWEPDSPHCIYDYR